VEMRHSFRVSIDFLGLSSRIFPVPLNSDFFKTFKIFFLETTINGSWNAINCCILMWSKNIQNIFTEISSSSSQKRNVPVTPTTASLSRRDQRWDSRSSSDPRSWCIWARKDRCRSPKKYEACLSGPCEGWSEAWWESPPSSSRPPSVLNWEPRVFRLQNIKLRTQRKVKTKYQL